MADRQRLVNGWRATTRRVLLRRFLHLAWGNSVLLVMLILAGAALFLCPATADPPAAAPPGGYASRLAIPDPLPLHRVLIPAGRVPVELERVRQGILVQQPRREFEAAVQEAADAGERVKRPPRLVQARYWARLVGTSLIGGGDWTVVNPTAKVGILPVPSLNLALGRVKIGASDAVLGDLDGKALGLLVEEGKEHSVFFDWTLRGGQEVGGLHFDLQIPPCAVASLDLTLPAEASVSVSRTVAVLSGPLDAGDSRQRLWRLRFTGRSAVDLVIRKPDQPDHITPLIVASLAARQQLTPARVRANFEVQVEVLHQPIRQLVFDFDPTLEPFEVSLRNIDLKEWKIEPAPPAGPAQAPPGAPARRLIVELRDPFQGALPPLQIHCLARLPVDKPWTSPWLRLCDAAVQGETLKLEVHPDVRLENWQPGGFRLVGTATAMDGSQTLTLVGSAASSAASPLRRPAARVKTQGVDFLARQRTWWQIGPQGSSLIAEITYEVSRGSLIELPVALPAGWQVDEVSVEPKEWLRSWVPVTTGGQPTLVVELQRALTPRQEVHVAVRLHASHGKSLPAGGKSYEFPELAPLDPCVREGTLALSVDPLFEATVLRASVPATAPDATGPWGRVIPTFSFNSRNQPVAGTLRLKPRPPSMQAICRSEFVLGPGSTGMSVRLALEATAGAPDSVDLQFSGPVPNGWEWKCLSRPDLIRGVQRVRVWDAGRYLLALGQRQGLAAVSTLAAPAFGECWRLTFNHPLGRSETLTFQSTLKQLGRRYPGAGQELAWQWQLPLVTVPSAASMAGEASLLLAGTELLDVTAVGLRDREHGNTEDNVVQPGSAAAGYGYRYGNTGPSARFPVLLVRTRALPTDRMAQESCDRARLVTRVEPGGRLVHCFSFNVWNWRQRVVPVRLPVRARLLTARVDGRWVGRLSAVETPDAVEVGLPVTGGEGIHRLEIVYTTFVDLPLWALGAALDNHPPELPVSPMSFRQTWRLPPGVAPVSEDGLLRLPDAEQDFDPGTWWEAPGVVWRSGNAWLADLAGLPSQREWLTRQRQAVEAAETTLRQGPRTPQTGALGLVLERLALSLSREQIALVVDVAALRAARLNPHSPLVLSPAATLGGRWRPFWEGLGLVYVPSRSGALLTTRRQWETWQTSGGAELLSSDLEDAIYHARINGHDGSDRFRSAMDWVHGSTAAEDPSAVAPPAGLADDCSDDLGLGWTEWEALAGSNARQPLLVVRRGAVRVLGWTLAGILALLAWRVRRVGSSRWRFGLMVAWLAAAGLSVLWLPPSLRAAAWGPALTGFAVALVWYGRLIKPEKVDRQSSSGDGSNARRLMTGGVATGIGILFLAACPGGTPLARSQPPDPNTVLLVPGPEPGQEMALATPQLLAKLKELKERGGSAARGVVSVSAVYEGAVSGGLADFKAEFQVYNFADRATLTLPVSGVELKEGALVDGAAAYPIALPAPQVGYTVAITGRGPHTVNLLFASRVMDAGEHTELNFTVPKLPQSRLVVTLAAGAQAPTVLSALGAQQARPAENGQVRVDADLGRDGTVHLRWLASSRPVKTLKVQVREAYWWDLRQPTPSLTAVLHYAPANGAVGRFSIQLPAGVDVRSVEARQSGAPAEGVAPARLKTWRVASGDNRQLQVELQTPVVSPVQLTLGLVPQLAAGPNELLLALPTPQDAKPTEGFLAYQVKNWDVLDKAQYLGITNLSPQTFVKVWSAAGMPGPGLPTRAYTFRRTPGGVSALALVLQEPRPQAAQEVSWYIQPGYADFRAKVDIKSAREDVMLLEWDVPPELTVADVRGPEVDHWSRAAQRVQVWLRAAQKTTSVELSGWVAYPPGGPGGGLVTLPSFPLKSAKFGEFPVRVAWAPPVELTPEQLQNMTPLPAQGPGLISYLAKQPSHRAVFRVRPASPRLEARALTPAKTNGDHVLSPVPTLPRVQILSDEHEAALGDGQHWLHQAAYHLLVSGPSDLRLQLPAGARFLGLTLDGKLLAPQQPSPESLWVRLPGSSGPSVLRLRWVFKPGGELVDQPNLASPRFEGLTAPAAGWIVHVPPFYEAKQVGEGHFSPSTSTDFELRRAGVMMKQSALIAQGKDAGSPAGQMQIAGAQSEFFGHLRRAEYQIALAAAAASHPGDLDAQLRARVQQIRKDNARLAREHGFDKLRIAAENQPEHGMVNEGERFFALPRQGTPTYWVGDTPGQAPRLRLTATASRHVRRTMIVTEVFLIFLAGIVMLSNLPRVTAWVRKLWPEQLMLIAWLGCEAFGLSPLGVLLFVSGGLFRLAWLANAVQRRWHRPDVTAARAGSS